MTLEPPGWHKVRFDEMASVVAERVDPAEASVDRYVGLEHLDPETLTIERWGHPSEVVGSKFQVRRGQIIFGKRRFYQRKVAVAPFDCICSAHAMVLEERTDVVAKGFLPHFMLSGVFVERALAISEGSLSPTIKWKRLAEQEFMLPPLDRQGAICSLLETLDDAIRRASELGRCARTLMASFVEHRVWSRLKPSNTTSLAEIAAEGSIWDGDWIEAKDQSDDGVRLLQLADIGLGEFRDRSNRYVSPETFDRLGCREVLPGDLLISRMADPLGRACVVPHLSHRLITAVDVAILRLPQWRKSLVWNAILNSPSWLSICASHAGGSTRQRIARSKLESIEVPALDQDAEVELEHYLEPLVGFAAQTESHVLALKGLKLRLTGQLIGPAQ